MWLKKGVCKKQGRGINATGKEGLMFEKVREEEV